ncbi:MAG TPA: helicase, partial [Sphingopyxis sp.]
KPLVWIAEAAADANTPALLRALLVPLAEAGGVLERRAIDQPLAALDKAARHQARRLGLVIGTLDIFHPQLLRPEAMRWRAALMAARGGAPMPVLPPPGAAMLATPSALPDFRTLGRQALRVDLAERIARAAHDARDGRRPFTPDPSLAVSLGLSADSLARLMRQLGFEPKADGWAWRGRIRRREVEQVRADGHFAELAELVAANGR